MGLHDGHRDRLKKQFYDHGLEVFNDINALEMLLFFSIPRRDTNETAHRLLNHFGSLSRVFSASMQELMEVPGVGERSALLITFIQQLIKKIEISKTADIKYINNPDDAGRYFLPRFVNEGDEVLYLLCLDSKRAIIKCCEIAKGTVNSVDVNARRIFQTALSEKACSVILAHNHPRGLPIPSKEDEMLTVKICKGLREMGIKLEDHIIVAENKYASMEKAGVLSLYRF